jgi:hypothetical protein
MPDREVEVGRRKRSAVVPGIVRSIPPVRRMVVDNDRVFGRHRINHDGQFSALLAKQLSPVPIEHVRRIEPTAADPLLRLRDRQPVRPEAARPPNPPPQPRPEFAKLGRRTSE